MFCYFCRTYGTYGRQICNVCPTDSVSFQYCKNCLSVCEICRVQLCKQHQKTWSHTHTDAEKEKNKKKNEKKRKIDS